MEKWAASGNDLKHFIRIASELSVAHVRLPPYVGVIRTDGKPFRGWVIRSEQRTDAVQNIPPTAWHGAIVIRTPDGEIEIDYMDIRSLLAVEPPESDWTTAGATLLIE
jgi:hypothetical protein